jgi:hypothetical protein
MIERAGCPLPGGRAVAARGRLAAAVRAGDLGAVEVLLSEISLGPGDLRRDLLCWAAAAGDFEMTKLLLDRLGPWGMGEEVEAVAALVRAGHWRLVPRLHAAAAGPLRTQLLRGCIKHSGAWLQPHAELMLWTLGATTNPAALDLMVSKGPK